MWNLLDEGVRSKFGDVLHRLVDLYHLTEKLAAAAHAIDTDSKVAGERLNRWKMVLIHRDRAATDILQELVRSGLDEGVGENRPVHAAITYLQTHSADADRMNYARARRLGLPLGSGNAEATCKSLFEVRMKRCGARWKETTGEHMADGLHRLLAEVQHKPIPPLVPEYCLAVPEHIEVDAVIQRTQPTLSYYGYDMCYHCPGDTKMRVVLRDRNNHDQDITFARAVPTHYLMTIDLNDTRI